MSTSRQVILSGDLGEFFRQEVAEARTTLGMQLPEPTEYYLVNLLCDFTRRDSPLQPGEEALALLYKRAVESDLAERLRRFKHLGDLALFEAGLFSEFVERSLVDIDYYISMGGSAYTNVSRLHGARSHRGGVGELYAHLAESFAELVDLLNEVAVNWRERIASSKDLLKLYERWLRTGDPRLHKALLAKGMLTALGLPDSTLQ